MTEVEASNRHTSQTIKALTERHNGQVGSSSLYIIAGYYWHSLMPYVQWTLNITITVPLPQRNHKCTDLTTLISFHDLSSRFHL